MSKRDQTKARAKAYVDKVLLDSGISEEVRYIASYLHERPEISSQEVESSRLLVEHLRRRGFAVAQDVAGLDTAFVAEKLVGSTKINGVERKGSTKPTSVAFLAEYDALPDLGHACGHNLIAAAAYGAAAALSQIFSVETGSPELPDMGHFGPVKVVVFGTPAEESKGGKIVMADAGCFNGVDAAFYFHPGTQNVVGVPWLMSQTLTVTFHGRSAHAAVNPHKGINALTAVLVMFSSINGLRQNLPRGVLINGIIKEGGRVVNIIPEYAEADVEVRALSERDFREGIAAVKRSVEAGAVATEARAAIRELAKYEAKVRIPALDRLLRDILGEAGIPARIADDSLARASSDAGNASRRMPIGDFMLAIAPRTTALHSAEFAKYAGSKEGIEAAVTAASVMAKAALEVIMEEGLKEEVNAQFKKGLEGTAEGGV
ncbi:MAG TPA: M20 family metallopeptidase [Clostridia bacterium]|nr:M20 family metallopeptidase [Clostridia bacterium]